MNDAPQAAMAAGQDVTPNVRLIGRLGAGGMGAVWLAHHKSLHRQVVVKFMLGELDSSGPAKKRFEREAAAAAAVKSPHVVQMHDYGVTEDGVPFIVMEHLEGRDLGMVLKDRGALDPAFVVEVVSQVAKALARVHAAGLLHRDVKPDNIFLCDADEGEIYSKLLDFGIAKSAAGEDGTLDGETKTGQVVGTPFYMSPEQVTAQKTIDARADLWALGVVTFELLTGARPFDGPSFGALAVKIATGDPVKATDLKPELGPGFDAWFAKACAREPNERFGSARAMAEALRETFGMNPAGVNSDSGQRSGPRSAVVSSARSGDPPAFGLASTINDVPSGESSLAKSAAATTSDTQSTEGSKKGSRNVVVAVSALVVAVVVTAVAMNRTQAPESPAARAPASASVRKAASVAPPPAASSVETVIAVGGTAEPPPAVHDAGAKVTAPVSPPRPPIGHVGHVGPAPVNPTPPVASSAKRDPLPVAPKPSSTLVSPY